MPQRSVVERWRIAYSIKNFLETAPVKAASSASSWRSAKAGGPARRYVSWDRGTKQHAHVTGRPYLSCFNASLSSADTPVPQAAAKTAEGASGCVTHTSTTTGHPRRYRRRSPHWGPRGERGVGRGVPGAPPERGSAAELGGVEGMGAGGEALAGDAMATAALGSAAALATAGVAAAEAAPGVTGARQRPRQ